MTLACTPQTRRYTAGTCPGVSQQMSQPNLEANGRWHHAQKPSNSEVLGLAPDLARDRPKTISCRRDMGGPFPRRRDPCSRPVEWLGSGIASLRRDRSPAIWEPVGQDMVADRRFSLPASRPPTDRAAGNPNPLQGTPRDLLAEAGRVHGASSPAFIGLGEALGHLGFSLEFRMGFQRRYNSRFDMAGHPADACDCPHGASRNFCSSATCRPSAPLYELLFTPPAIVPAPHARPSQPALRLADAGRSNTQP